MAGANLLAKLNMLVKRPKKIENANVEVERFQKDLNADFETVRKEKSFVNTQVEKK